VYTRPKRARPGNAPPPAKYVFRPKGVLACEALRTRGMERGERGGAWQRDPGKGRFGGPGERGAGEHMSGPSGFEGRALGRCRFWGWEKFVVLVGSAGAGFSPVHAAALGRELLLASSGCGTASRCRAASSWPGPSPGKIEEPGALGGTGATPGVGSTTIGVPEGWLDPHFRPNVLKTTKDCPRGSNCPSPFFTLLKDSLTPRCPAQGGKRGGGQSRPRKVRR